MPAKHPRLLVLCGGDALEDAVLGVGAREHADARGGLDHECAQGGIVGGEAHLDDGEHAMQHGLVAEVLHVDHVLGEDGDRFGGSRHLWRQEGGTFLDADGGEATLPQGDLERGKVVFDTTGVAATPDRALDLADAVYDDTPGAGALDRPQEA